MLEHILTTSEMKQADARAIAAGTPGFELMERAGAAVAEAAARLLPDGGTIAVLAGPGNNGGDGFVAARQARSLGYKASVYLLGSPEGLCGDAAQAASLWGGTVAPLRDA